jgi:hypothetical protein
MARIDTAQLSEIISACFDFSMDGRLPQEVRNLLLIHGKRLRGAWVNLISAEFDGKTEEFKEASRALEEVDRSLKELVDDLENLVSTIEKVGRLVKTLDDILALATAFI